MQGSGVMTTEEPWFPDDDVLPRPPSVLVGTARACARLGAALLAVGALGVVLWLWIVLRQQGLLGGGGLDSLFGDRLGTTGNRLDVFATTFTFLTGAALTGGLGMALRLAGGYVIAEKGGPPARSTAGGRTPADDDGPPWFDDDDEDDDDGGEGSPWKGR